MENHPEPSAVAAAIITDVSSRMPTLAEITSGYAGDADMGPDLTLPAIHMHILAQHIRHLEGQVTQTGLELKIAQQTSIGLAPDDEGDARAIYAGRLAELVVRAFAGDHDEATSTLIHSAAAILATKYESRSAARALERGAAMFADDIRRKYGAVGRLQ